MATAYHTVVKGSSLSKIGAYYGVAWQTIAQANNIKAPYTIYAGQRLVIPNAKTPTSTPAQGGGTPVVNSTTELNGAVDKLIGGILLYGIFRVLMKVF